MRVILERIDGLLPIGRQDVAVIAIKSLTDLGKRQPLSLPESVSRDPTLAHVPV